MIVCKVEYNDFSETDWVLSLEQTWLNTAVHLWVEILNQFEGINDAINVNFTKEFGEQLTSKKDCSLQEALLAFDTLVKPIAKNFKTLGEFVEYLACTVGEQTIVCKAHGGLLGPLKELWYPVVLRPSSASHQAG